MTRHEENKDIARQLRQAYLKKWPDCKSGERSIRLPSSIGFVKNGSKMHLCMRPKGVISNMQNNAASFEGWALAVKRWLPEINAVELAWPSDNNGHYQRFLYRVKKFAEVFEWFTISPANTSDLRNLKTNDPRHKCVLNAPSEPRVLPREYPYDSISQVLSKGNEHDLECFVVHKTDCLKKLFSMDQLDRQLPVGVFQDKVSKTTAHEIFPRGHSAIDIWGISEAGRKLLLFELKKEKNIPLGILSEMFFYSFVMEDVQTGHFRFETPNDVLSLTKSTSTYILAPQWHPLIDVDLLLMANEAFGKSNRCIWFGAVRIAREAPHYRLEARAYD